MCVSTCVSVYVCVLVHVCECICVHVCECVCVCVHACDHVQQMTHYTYNEHAEQVRLRKNRVCYMDIGHKSRGVARIGTGQGLM